MNVKQNCLKRDYPIYECSARDLKGGGRQSEKKINRKRSSACKTSMNASLAMPIMVSNSVLCKDHRVEAKTYNSQSCPWTPTTPDETQRVVGLLCENRISTGRWNRVWQNRGDGVVYGECGDGGSGPLKLSKAETVNCAISPLD
ncbi:hypothetical protein EVAR_39915_1 [Eumeta japonica]|uniref:Uncharacterized protein n=1 Tax=Eumeta variegata TaxID=151549 RepID=A0A4C1WLX3_EUMVA|nr:hypothetical protein EVAR_39915_1 [Eumeta japonica]